MKKVKHILLLITLLFLGQNSFAQFSPEQQHQIDSLNKIINNLSSHDTSLASAYVGLSEILYISNIDTLKFLCEKAELIATKGLAVINNPEIKRSFQESLAIALNNIGYVYNNQGQTVKALEQFHRSLKIQEEIGNKQGLANSLNNIGVIYKHKGDIENALKYYYKALKIQEEIGNKEGIAAGFNNIGILHKQQGEIDQAIEYYHKALQIQEEIGNKTGIAYALSNIGNLYNNQFHEIKPSEVFRQKQLLDKAMEYYDRALRIRQEIGNQKGVAISLIGMADVYKKRAMLLNISQVDRDSLLDTALQYYQKSLKIREEIGDREGVVYSLVSVGRLSFLRKEFANANNAAQKSLTIAQEINSSLGIRNSANLLAKTNKAMGKYKKALKMYELYIVMRDSINSVKTFKTAVQQEAKYNYEKQAIQDSIVNAETEKVHLANLAAEEAKSKRQETEVKAQKKQKVYLYVGLFLVALFGLFMFNRFRVTQKQKQIIEVQKEQVEEAHKEITDSINYAERIQRSFLATETMLNKNLQEYFVFFQPKDVVSGDFYWADELSNGTFAMVNADSTGHGVPGAIMSILNISSIELAIERGSQTPQAIFNSTRKTIIQRLKKDGSKEGGKDGMDASIVCFDFKNLKMTYCAAKNPIWIIREGEVIQIKPEKMPVGKHDKDTIPFVGGEIQLQKGDQVYTLTDGFQDQFGGDKGKKFMVKKMREYVLSISHLPMAEQYEKIANVFSEWKGDIEQVDDVCVIGVLV